MKLHAAYSAGSKRFAKDLSQISSAEPPLIFLLRHGRIRDAHIRRFIGQTDVPLDHAGRTQAAAWQADFDLLQFDAVYSSTLCRARETAAIACPGRTVRTDVRLNEINLGDWDGLPMAAIKGQHPKAFEERGRAMDTFRPPNGESFSDLEARILPFFKDLPAPAQSRTLVVTHAGVMRTLICHIQNRPLSDLFSIRLSYGQLFVITNLA